MASRFCSLAMVVLLVLCGCGQTKNQDATPKEAPKPGAKQAAPQAVRPAETGDVDEFGVSLASTPPPPVPGYGGQKETIAAVMEGKVEMFDIDGDMPLPEGVEEKLNIEYKNVDGKSVLLDLYMPTVRSKPMPGLLFIHGGGWSGGEPKDYRYYAVRYAKRGYVVASITYRLAPQTVWPAQLQDVKDAVRWMRVHAAEYSIDPERLAAIGGSAGGHLSMMIGYTPNVAEFDAGSAYPGVSSQVKVVVNLYGPCDLDTEVGRHSSQCKTLTGKTYEEDPELYKKISPINYITKDAPPTLIFHGSADETVPIGQEDILVAKLKEMGVPYEYEPFPDWPHTMDLALDVNKRVQWFMNRFFEKHLKGGQ